MASKRASATWQFVMDEMKRTKVKHAELTSERYESAFNEAPFDALRQLILIETRPDAVLKTLLSGTVSTNIFMRRLHSFALNMGWLPWPRLKYGTRRAITAEEAQRLLDIEPNPEWKAFLQLLWHIGAAQVDSYAAFMALNELIRIYDTRRCQGFRQRLVVKTIESHQELAARVDAFTFFRILLDAFHAGCFGRTAAERQRFFKFVRKDNAGHLLSERQLRDGAEYSHRVLKGGFLYLVPETVLDVLRQRLYSQGQRLALDQHDLQALLKFKGYFVTSSNRQGHHQKFGKGSRTNIYCWAIDLSKFPELGVLSVSDETWEASFYPDGDKTRSLLLIEEWVDPRKGELFTIVDGLEDKE